MSDEYEISAPMLTVTLEERPRRPVLVFLAVTAIGVALTACVVYLMAFWLPSWIGFESAVLTALALIMVMSR